MINCDGYDLHTVIDFFTDAAGRAMVTRLCQTYRLPRIPFSRLLQQQSRSPLRLPLS